MSSMTTVSAGTARHVATMARAPEACKGFRCQRPVEIAESADPARLHDGSRRVAAVGSLLTVASPAPLAPGFSETPLWHADVGRPTAVDDPGPLPAEADVVIVGGGYCGVTAAAELAPRGMERRGRRGRRDRHRREHPQRRDGHPRAEARARELARRYGALGRRARRRRARRLRPRRAARRRVVDRLRLRAQRRAAARAPRAARPGLQTRSTSGQELLGDEARFLHRDELHGEIGTSAYHGGLARRADGRPATGASTTRDWSGPRSTRARVLHGRTRATRIARRPAGGYRVETTAGHRRGARDVLVATNAYADGCVPELRRRVLPIGSFIIATEPLDADLARSCSPRRSHVLRHEELPLLLAPVTRRSHGVRRTHEPRADDRLRRRATSCTREMVRVHPQLAGSRLEHSWGGNVAITFDRLPHCGRLPLPDGGDVAFATGCNGTGVALATWFGCAGRGLAVGRRAATGVRSASVPTGAAARAGAAPTCPRSASGSAAKDRLGL